MNDDKISNNFAMIGALLDPVSSPNLRPLGAGRGAGESGMR
jgi:hypothetical protein